MLWKVTISQYREDEDSYGYRYFAPPIYVPGSSKEVAQNHVKVLFDAIYQDWSDWDFEFQLFEFPVDRCEVR